VSGVSKKVPIAPYGYQELYQIKEEVGMTGNEQGFMSSSALLSSEQNSPRKQYYQ
jgi:hypothetical protein